MGKGGGGAQNMGGQPHSNLFIGNLMEDTADQTIKDVFSAYGTVLACRVFTRNGRTCALVKMSNVREAEISMEATRGWGPGDPRSTWQVKFADADVGKGGGKASLGLPNVLPFGMGKAPRAARAREQKDVQPSENLYVKGLPPRVTEAQLQTTFSRVGHVVESKIMRYGDSLECAALVRMSTIEAATAAIEQLNGTTPEGSVPPISIAFHGKDPTAISDNLYIKGLPLNTTTEQLQEMFCKMGTVRQCRLLQSTGFQTNQMDAVALVRMGNTQEAQEAIQMLNGRVPDGIGPPMFIRYAEPKPEAESKTIPSDNLYVKGLPLGTPDFLLRAVFAQYGRVVRLRILEPRANEANDSAALVQMGDSDEAAKAIQELHGRVLAAPLPPMRVRYAGKDQEPSGNLYVAGLPTTILEQQLHQSFAQYGTVVRARLLCDPNKPETHALVQMSSADEAANAIEQLNNKPPVTCGPTLIVRFANERPKRDQLEGEKANEGNEAFADAPVETGDNVITP
jgi:RNA recognition motif-containing protein